MYREGSKGLGAASARLFSESGARVVITFSNDARARLASSVPGVRQCRSRGIHVGARLQAKSDVADRRIPGGDNSVTVVLFSGSHLTPPWHDEERLVETTDQLCPYSNATRGNIDVAINLV